MICSALLCYPFFREPIFGLAVGVILGGILQVLLQIPFLLRTGFTFRGRISFSHPGLKRIFILLAPAAIGLAVYQLNILVDMLLASFLPRGSISFLYYADRVIEVPMGIFATALATAVLPTMSEKTALNDMGGLKETLHHSLRTLLFIILPATLALAVLCTPITNVLFEHGKFGPEETLLTSRALLAFTVGLLGIGGVRIVVPVFYSLKDTWTPMRVALIAFLANLTLNLILMVPLKHAGLALSTSIAAYLNLSLLFYLLHRKIGAFHFSDVLSAGLKMLLAAGLMCALLMLAVHQIEWSAQTRLIIRILALAVMVGMGGIIYLLAAYLLKIEELNTFLNPVLRKLRSLRG
jgi:putative peptidoglycan lipid II flippase